MKILPCNSYIVDLGMHVGDDTFYYLTRGFRVVAVEANPELVNRGAERFSEYLQDGRLIIVNAALSDRAGVCNFFVSNNDEWSSMDRWRAEAAGVANVVQVPTISLYELLVTVGNGVPYYIKCDIEGADVIFLRQLGALDRKFYPQYLSAEGISIEWLALLFVAGYENFKLVNQAMIRRYLPTIDFTINGMSKRHQFQPHSSGPFGDDIEGNWLSFGEAAMRWLDFQRIKDCDQNMVLDNWFDFHCKL